MKNQKGMGLIQVMVVAALVGGLSLSVMKIAKLTNNIRRQTNLALEEQDLRYALLMIMRNDKYCSESLAIDESTLGDRNFRKEDIDDTPLAINALYTKDSTGNRIKKFEVSTSYGRYITFGKFELFMNHGAFGTNYTDQILLETQS